MVHVEVSHFSEELEELLACQDVHQLAVAAERERSKQRRHNYGKSDTALPRNEVPGNADLLSPVLAPSAKQRHRPGGDDDRFGKFALADALPDPSSEQTPSEADPPTKIEDAPRAGVLMLRNLPNAWQEGDVEQLLMACGFAPPDCIGQVAAMLDVDGARAALVLAHSCSFVSSCKALHGQRLLPRGLRLGVEIASRALLHAAHTGGSIQRKAVLGAALGVKVFDV